MDCHEVAQRATFRNDERLSFTHPLTPSAREGEKNRIATRKGSCFLDSAICKISQ
ncbi:hypothetical protein [Helicobacter sp. 23-1045]